MATQKAKIYRRVNAEKVDIDGTWRNYDDSWLRLVTEEFFLPLLSQDPRSNSPF